MSKVLVIHAYSTYFADRRVCICYISYLQFTSVHSINMRVDYVNFCGSGPRFHRFFAFHPFASILMLHIIGGGLIWSQNIGPNVRIRSR